MLGKARFLLFYFLTWVLLFEVFRLLFLSYHFGQTKQLPFATLLQTLLYGLRMDLSMASYLTLPVCIFVLLSIPFLFFRKASIYIFYTALILLFIVPLIVFDLEVYKQWLFRIDVTPLKYLSSPREAWASISHLPVFFILVGLLLIYVVLVIAFKKILQKSVALLQQSKHWAISLFSICILLGLLGIGIRGGLQLAPINQSSVYFSTTNFANHAAINATWNFLHSVMNQAGSKRNPYVYMDENRAKVITDSLYASTGKVEKVLNTDTPNVILIIWESFTDKATHISIDGREVTPGFNQLKKEGLYFSQIYASGDRTDKGLSAILSGYPALPKTSVIRTPNKAAKLPTLSKVLRDRNYQTPFYYGGEPEFANIKSYLLQGGFTELIEKSDFDKKDWNSKWGAHDGIVANRFFKDINNLSTPYFATWLTLSSHEPYEVPGAPIFNTTNYNSQFFNSLHYTDGVITDFVNKAKHQAWWKNTLLIIVADHGHILPETGKRIDNFKIPMLWLGGALQKKGVHDKMMGQTDLAASLLSQIDLSATAFSFSKNTFDSTSTAWSFFSFNNGFGWVEPNGYTLFDHVGKRIEDSVGLLPFNRLARGKALQQIIFSDFINK